MYKYLQHVSLLLSPLPPSLLLCVPGAASTFCRQIQRAQMWTHSPAGLGFRDHSTNITPRNPRNVLTAFFKKYILNPLFTLISGSFLRSFDGTEALKVLSHPWPVSPEGGQAPRAHRARQEHFFAGWWCEPRGWIWGTEHHGLSQV